MRKRGNHSSTQTDLSLARLGKKKNQQHYSSSSSSLALSPTSARTNFSTQTHTHNEYRQRDETDNAQAHAQQMKHTSLTRPIPSPNTSATRYEPLINTVISVFTAAALSTQTPLTSSTLSEKNHKVLGMHQASPIENQLSPLQDLEHIPYELLNTMRTRDDGSECYTGTFNCSVVLKALIGSFFCC